MVARFLCLVMLVSPLAAIRAQGVCSPPALGHPCSMGGVATLGPAEPGLGLGIGNPVHLATGNKHQHEIDLPANPQAPLLQVARHYNSLDPRHGAFGQGWSTSYDTRVYHAGGRYQIVQADGSRIDFGRAGEWPLRNDQGTLRADGPHWTWSWPDGRSLRFDAQGQLIRIAAPGARPGAGAHPAPQFAGPDTHADISSQRAPAALDTAHVIDIVRHAQAGPLRGSIAHITASNRRNIVATLRFHHRIHAGRAYVSAIDTPLGRFDYRYEPSPQAGGAAALLRLAAVRRPDGYERHYLHEADRQSGMPHLLTGVALAPPDGPRLRTHSWAYDAQGRAIASEQHHPAQGAYALRISYERPASAGQKGLTVVEGADGRQTRLEFGLHAGRHRLLQVSGAPCPGCAAPGSAAGYDEQGRLQWLNGSAIVRNASGTMQRLVPHAPGWPGLYFDFDAQGRRKAWHAASSGTEETRFDSLGRPALRRFANGDEWHYHYDEHARPIRVMARNRRATLLTRLAWQGNRLAAVRHPQENEWLRYDPHGRLAERRVQRPLSRAAATRRAYVERFEYDGQHRLAVHHLPEGGALRYDWSPQGRLMRLDWVDDGGRRHEVIRAWPGQAGYRYGNGLGLALHFEQGSVQALTLYDGNAVVWDHFRAADPRGRPVREADRFAAAPHHAIDWRYAYDSQSRLAAASSSSANGPSERWHAWRSDGSIAALRLDGETMRPHIRRDASGLPQKVDGFELRYGPQRRLEQLRRNGNLVERYRHNAFGHRIEAESPTEHVQYFYLGNRLVAESRQPRQRGSQPDGRLVTRRYIHAGDVIVGMIDYGREAPSGTLYAVHADLLGMPRLITDARRHIRWLARHTPFGAAHRLAGDLDFKLRLPGQLADAASGWHDNLLRTYHPGLGQYLEPDPLGPLPGTQALGYAGQQPRRYVDPLGLLLFAFDGTRQNAQNRSNVWLFGQQYQDGPVFYHSGPGNPYYLDMDALAAHSAPQTIETQWQHLLNALHGATPRADQTLPIDIIGYSRGAALARHFGNLIEQHVDQGLFSYADPLRGQISACVDLRFMGLFDTVAQLGLGGALNTLYDFSISAAWGWVAHAVALHERRWLFPLLAATGDIADNVVEAPFVGAHANIGGGVPLGEKSSAQAHGDLSDVALNWMLWQARAASVPLSRLAAEQATVSEPVLHDQRPAPARSVQEGDRRVDGPDGRKQLDYQDDHHRLGRAQRQATEALINRYDDWRRSGSSEVGTVDLDAYARWLYDELGWRAEPLL
ncbi:DUF6531 domain-containing protein [Pusillimonas noertemannii]|uniref:DUF6531 domain-containing protein n=1 Tax=Pusillimonas noertemannii TaxID=305977 RepID=UPI0002DA1C8C|nr:DUF2235 domain-containing protein [Pusillimonas noertemannii]